jgi:hypothetical protein
LKVYAVTGRTESGDEYVFVFSSRPSQEEIDAAYERDMPEEWEAGCVGGGTISECEIINP